MSFEEWEQRYPLGHGVRVLAVHPAGLIALEKPVNTLSHPNSSRDQKRSLVNAPYDRKTERYHDLNEHGDELYLCHRLDSGTSGVILLAQNERMAKVARERFSTHRMEKNYLAIINGQTRPQDNWVDLLPPHALPYARKDSQDKRPVEMRCRVQFMELDGNRLGLSLVKLIPTTGRTHQLRIQTSRRGLPILGDRRYGDFRLNRTIAGALKTERLYLHASRVAFDFMHEGKLQKFRVESPMPNDFRKVLDTNAPLSRLNFNFPGSRPSRQGVPHTQGHRGSHQGPPGRSRPNGSSRRGPGPRHHR